MIGMSGAGKRIDVAIVDFYNPGENLPSLKSMTGEYDVTCESATKLYEHLSAKELTRADGKVITLIHYEANTGDETLAIRNVCGKECKAILESPQGSYCGPTVDKIKEKLGIETDKDNFLLILEKGAELESSVQCAFNTLEQEGFRINYCFGEMKL